MSKLYNTYPQITSDLKNFFVSISSLTKPILKLIPNIILGMISSESVVTSDIAKKFRTDLWAIQHSSNIRKIERFLNNPRFQHYSFYDDIISYVITNYISKNDNIYISIDHMFCKDSFVVLMFSLKIGKQGIPLWFRCFKGSDNPDAFKTSLILEGIDYIASLFGKNRHLVFLADRWFPNIRLMKHIDTIGATYYIRAKSNMQIHIDDFEDMDMIAHISDLEPYLTKSKYFDSVQITKKHFQTKLAISKSEDHEEPYFILTNGDTRKAIKQYSYRFGAIETIFKNQKSNGFYLEATKIRNIQAFTSLFTLVCIALLWLTILGADYSKNKSHFKSYFKIRTSKKNGNGSKRIVSLFNTGLTLFNLAYESSHYVKLKCDFHLYDI